MSSYTVTETIDFLGQDKTVKLAGAISGIAWVCLARGHDGNINVLERPLSSLWDGAFQCGMIVLGTSLVQWILPKELHAVIPVCLSLSVANSLCNTVFKK